MKYWTLVLFSDLFLVTGCGKSILYYTDFNGDRWIFCQKDLFSQCSGPNFCEELSPYFSLSGAEKCPNLYNFFWGGGLGKGSIKKKKSGIFQIWSEPPTHPCNRGKSGKKIKFLLF